MKTLEIIKLEFKNAIDNTNIIEPILSNDIKKGDLVQQVNGWFAECIDNMRGNIRMFNVHGMFTEMGSIYVWDISNVCKDGKYYRLELTPKQRKDKKKSDMFFK